MSLLPSILLLSALILLILHRVLSPPSSFPSLPTIPLPVSLLGFLTPLSQPQIYARYLSPYLSSQGAAAYFFGSRWNILLQKPAHINHILRNEDVFAKSGNQKKIPYSVLAALTGDNIISAHGEVWRLYQGVMRPGLVREWDVEGMRRDAGVLVDLMVRDQDGQGVVVNGFLQRFAMAVVGRQVLGTDFGTLESDTAPIHVIHTALKKEIFKPLFLNFPFLDRLPLPSRLRARALVRSFEHTLFSTVTSQNPHLDPSSLVGRMQSALSSGTWTHQQFLDNLKIVFIAGHENIQQLLTSLLFILAKHPEMQSRLRDEILQKGKELDLSVGSNLHSLPLLAAVVLETLRLFPPIPQLVNRKTTTSHYLPGLSEVIPAGTYVGWTAYGAQRDVEAWGEDAEEFRPERWGGTVEEVQAEMRRRNRRGEFVAFHGGKRACLGQGLALLETKVAVVEMLRRVEWEIAEGWREKFTPGGLLAPVGLRVVFRELERK